MNRRGFLGFLGAAIAGATLDPERLLWEPGKKIISIPSVDLVESPMAEIMAAQIEFMRPQLEQLFQMSDVLWRKLQDGRPLPPQRPVRIPFRLA